MVSLFAQRRVDRMSGDGKHDIRAELGVVPDINVRIVYDRQVKIGVDIPPKVDMFARPIGMEGWLNIAAFTKFGEHLMQQCFALGAFGRSAVVEVVQTVKARRLLGQQRRIGALVQRFAVHFLLVGHGKWSSIVIGGISCGTSSDSCSLRYSDGLEPVRCLKILEKASASV